MNHKGGHRAARAAKNIKKNKTLNQKYKYRCYQLQGGFFDWFRPKSSKCWRHGKIPNKKVKVRVCHREYVKF